MRHLLIISITSLCFSCSVQKKHHSESDSKSSKTVLGDSVTTLSNRIDQSLTIDQEETFEELDYNPSSYYVPKGKDTTITDSNGSVTISNSNNGMFIQTKPKPKKRYKRTSKKTFNSNKAASSNSQSQLKSIIKQEKQESESSTVSKDWFSTILGLIVLFVLALLLIGRNHVLSKN